MTKLNAAAKRYHTEGNSMQPVSKLYLHVKNASTAAEVLCKQLLLVRMIPVRNNSYMSRWFPKQGVSEPTVDGLLPLYSL